jgi:hypothetical protein
MKTINLALAKWTWVDGVFEVHQIPGTLQQKWETFEILNKNQHRLIELG